MKARPTDLEDPVDLARLAEPMTALRDLVGLVVIDEVQRHPELFPALRVLVDRRPSPASFLVLGSASPAALRQTSESLTGRVEVLELGGLGSVTSRRNRSRNDGCAAVSSPSSLITMGNSGTPHLTTRLPTVLAPAIPGSSNVSATAGPPLSRTAPLPELYAHGDKG